MSSFTRTTERAFSYTLLAPAFLPLVLFGGVFYPFVTSKTLFIRIDALLAFAAFAVLLAAGKSFFFERLQRSLVWVPGALLLIAYIASFFGADFATSFWSTFVRGDGLATLTAVIGLFYLTVLTADELHFKRLFACTAWVGILVGALGLLEWLATFGNIALPLLSSSGDRIGSTFGNAAFLASYLTCAACVTLMVRLDARGGMRVFFLYAALLEVLIAILTATRGSIFALSVLAVLGLGYFVMRGGEGARRKAAGTLVALLACVILGFAFRADLRSVPFAPLARVAQISTSDEDVASRLFIWQHVTAETITSGHWFLGYGSEHISIPFDQVYDPTVVTEEWFDRTHDVYLDYFVQYGIGAIILFVLLVGTVLHRAWRLWYSKKESSGLYVFGAGALYALQNIFIFDTASTLWLLLALFAFLISREVLQEKREVARVPRVPVLVAACVPLIALWWVVGVPLEASALLSHAYTIQLTDPRAEERDLTAGYALGTYGNVEYAYEAYDMYKNQLAVFSGDALDVPYEAATNILTKAYNAYPYDARTALYLSEMLSNPPPHAATSTVSEQDALQRAITLSPRRSQPWYVLTNQAIAAANAYPTNSAERKAGYAKAASILTAYETLVPRLAEPHFALAELYLGAGDTDAASREAALGKEFFAGDEASARRAVTYYEQIQSLPDIAFFLSAITAKDATDYASLYDLAKVEFLLGKKAEAESVVSELRAKDSAILSTDPAFEAAITAYEKSATN